MPYISASIIMQLLTYVLPTFEQLKKGRRSRPSQDHPVHALWHAGLALFQSLGIAVALESSAGLVIAPGFGFPSDSGGTSDGRHHVPDVAG
jgi:preprotein translocase subunit SecY